MFKRPDLWIALVVISLGAFAVIKQMTYRADEEVVALKLGEALDLDIRLKDVSDVEQTVRVGEYTGKHFTVLYTWSTVCPCVEYLEPRMRKIHVRFNERNHGVGWLAIDGEPTDERKYIRKHMINLGAFYRMLRDPQQLVTQRLGLNQAVQVAIIDSHGVLRYRGSIDDSYEAEGVTKTYLADALEALVAGKEPAVPETPYVYGCAFNDPASCEYYEEKTKAVTGDETQIPAKTTPAKAQ